MQRRGESGQSAKGRRALGPKARKAPTASKADLQEQVAALTRERDEALEQQTATSEVLQVISSSPGELEPVFNAMLENATRICGAKVGVLWLVEGDGFRSVAVHGLQPAHVEQRQRYPVIRPTPEDPLGRLARTKQVVHIADLRVEEAYIKGFPPLRALVDVGGGRTLLDVPMLKEGELIGAIAIYRQEVHPFTDKQIELVQNFAAQAVIAIENTRLLKELRESLQQQTATADVLKVISSSPGELEPVFNAMLENTIRICEANFGNLLLYENDTFRHVALHNAPQAWAAEQQRDPVAPRRSAHFLYRVADTKQIIHISDITVENPDEPIAKVAGARTLLIIPMLKESNLIGAIAIYRQEVRSFTDKQIDLVKNFAAQAVIAIENTRLLNELRKSLQQQTATADVLKVISSSPGELEPVFQAMLENAVRICGARFGTLNLYEGDAFRIVAVHNVPPAFAEARLHGLIRPHPGGGHAELIRTKQVVHIEDIRAQQPYREGDPAVVAVSDVGGARTIVLVPMLKEDVLVGTISIFRQEVRPFTDKQIELVKNFAAQAVIAIENTRLLSELRQSLQQQTATADVLKVISRSSVDLETVLDTLVGTVARLCRADQAFMFRRHADGLHHLIAIHGLSEEAKAYVENNPFAPDRGTTSGRVALERRPIHIPDVLADPDYTYMGGQLAAGFRTLLGLPLLREDTLIGVFVIGRTRVDPFTNKEIELATSFADQAVIAIENARLFEELRDRQAELRVTFDNMGDGVVMFDAAAQLTAWNRNFQQMLDLPDAFLAGRPSYAEYFHYLADRGEYSIDLEAQLSRTIEDTSREMRFERARPDGRVIEVRRNPVTSGGFVLIYSDITERKHAEEAIRTARDAAEAALRDLQTAQDRLIQTEKLASLGQLTAGIAHEIKNPLNFVNNFSGLSSELIDELQEALTDVSLNEKRRSRDRPN